MTLANTDMTTATFQVQTITPGETGTFSPLFLDYLSAKADLQQYYTAPPTPEGVGQQLALKQDFPQANRETLVTALQAQYGELAAGTAVAENINALAETNTFTITTGHQLNIFTGPLYFIYKIVTVINACKALQVAHPDYHFVPVYWMASEDHDFEEIASFRLFNQSHTWETKQTGPVGRMNPKELESVLAALPESVPLFEQAYREHDTLADAVRYYVHQLFAEEGLVVIDADHATLKQTLAPVMRDDVQQHTANDLVEASSAAIQELGYKTQVFPRKINFFLMREGLRERIVRTDSGEYEVLNTNIRFSAAELQELIAEHPEELSPNVILRPLYQEMILPNLAYCGGPAEMVYWLQLKEVFAHYQVPFPILLPRNFALYINKGLQRKLDKTGISLQDLFLDFDSLRKKFVAEQSANELSLQPEQKALEAIFDTIQEKAAAIDQSLAGWVGAEMAKAIKSVDNIEKRLKKAEESKHATSLRQIEAVKDKLFPGGGLQERKDNFLNFYLNNPDFIKQLLGSLKPFETGFHVLTDHD